MAHKGPPPVPGRVSARRPVPTPPAAAASPSSTEPVTFAPVADVQALQEAVRKGQWRVAFKSAEKLARSNVAPHERCQFLLIRITGLVKLRMYSTAAAEVEAMGDLHGERYRFEAHPTLYGGGMTGSMVPWTLHVLRAQMPCYFDRHDHAVDALTALLAFVRTQVAQLRAAASDGDGDVDGSAATGGDVAVADGVPEHSLLAAGGSDPTGSCVSYSTHVTASKDINVWRSREIRLSYTIATMLLARKECNSGIQLLESLCRQYPDCAATWSCYARLLLHAGHVEGAVAAVQRADVLIPNPQQSSALYQMNHGYVCFARGAYEGAARCFARALELEPTNLVALNNHAVALLYNGGLGLAVKCVETHLFRQPAVFLNESLIFNLCTFYDLASDQSSEKKKILVKLVAQEGPDCFDPSAILVNKS